MIGRPLAIELAGLYLPLFSFLICLLYFRVHRRISVGIVMAMAWQLATLPIVNLWVQWLGFWSFESDGPILFGMPVSLYLGWAILWGLLVPLLAGRLPIRHPMFCVGLGAVLFDLIAMPWMSPVVELAPNWFWGELIVVGACLVPSLVLAHYTFLDRRPKLRAILITVAFILLVLVVLPFFREVDLFRGKVIGLSNPMVVLVLIASLPGMAAVREFATAGRGTPIPMDPPRTLVTTGVYAYLRNPMQTSVTGVLLLWSWIFESEVSLWLALAGIVYSVGLARWSENSDLEKKYGKSWLDFRSASRPWRPRLLPVSQPVPAVIFFDFQCGPCRQIERWFRGKSPIGLEIKDAAEFEGSPLKRVTYRYPSGVVVDGVEAMAVALCHLHFGWMMLASAVRLPGVLMVAEVSFREAFKLPQREGTQSQT